MAQVNQYRPRQKFHILRVVSRLMMAAGGLLVTVAVVHFGNSPTEVTSERSTMGTLGLMLFIAGWLATPESSLMIRISLTRTPRYDPSHVAALGITR